MKIVPLVVRTVVLGFGVASFWWGWELRESSRALPAATAGHAVDHLMKHDTESKADNAAGVLDSLGEAFGVIAMFFGGTASAVALFPWGLVLRESAGRAW